LDNIGEIGACLDREALEDQLSNRTGGKKSYAVGCGGILVTETSDLLKTLGDRNGSTDGLVYLCTVRAV